MCSIACQMMHKSERIKLIIKRNLKLNNKNICKKKLRGRTWKVILCLHTNLEMNSLRQWINWHQLIQIWNLRTPILSNCLQTIVCFQQTYLKQFQWIILQRFSIVWGSFRHSINQNLNLKARQFKMYGTFCIDQNAIVQMRFSPNLSSTSCASWWIWTI